VAIAGALIALSVSARAPARQFGNIVVDTTKDGNDGECTKDCTLREAIAVADSNTGRWVQVPPGVYKLTLGPLVLGNDIVFGVGFGGNQSAGARTTVIDARGASRVVQVAPNASAVIAGLTITGGGTVPAGGGALVPATSQLTFYDAFVNGNVASQRGAGIDNLGNLALWHTTMSGNRVTGGSAGGLAVEPDSNAGIFYSTISGNTASATGGGISAGGSLQMQNSTIAGNTAAAGGGLFQESTSSASTAMWSTVLAENTGGACGGSIAGIPRSITSHNLADDPS
jgi:CSLREA domain-containing protein